MSTVDEAGKTIKIGDDNLVRIDGIGVFRRIERAGVLYLQFMDTDRYRAKCRGSKFVEIPLHILVAVINPVQELKGTTTNELSVTNPTQS